MGAHNDHWSKFLLGPIFAVIGFFYRAYMANRERVARLLGGRWISRIIKAAMVLTLILWFAIWLLAPEESRKELTEMAKEFWGGLTQSLP